MDIPAAPTYGVYISDSRASGSYNIPAAPVYGVYISDSRAKIYTRYVGAAGMSILRNH
jgi:hypothetical protein